MGGYTSAILCRKLSPGSEVSSGPTTGSGRISPMLLGSGYGCLLINLSSVQFASITRAAFCSIEARCFRETPLPTGATTKGTLWTCSDGSFSIDSTPSSSRVTLIVGPGGLPGTGSFCGGLPDSFFLLLVGSFDVVRGKALLFLEATFLVRGATSEVWSLQWKTSETLSHWLRTARILSCRSRTSKA